VFTLWRKLHSANGLRGSIRTIWYYFVLKHPQTRISPLFGLILYSDSALISIFFEIFNVKTVFKDNITRYVLLLTSWGQCYKTFYGRKLRLFIKSFITLAPGKIIGRDETLTSGELLPGHVDLIKIFTLRWKY